LRAKVALARGARQRYMLHMHLHVDTSKLILAFGTLAIPCAIGKHGAIAESAKREGDGKTPLGAYKLRKVYARPDRVAAFATGLPITWLTPQHGWCDDAAHPLYNREVTLPFAASHEQLWREDGLYDLIVTLSHNEAPVVPGLGSAIFLHCCKYDDTGRMKPTLGCVAIPKSELLTLLPQLAPRTSIEIF
jgi:L,D-peptidoglycan transpeptidase YkuD (ErfK/YbiS/YcfS/YnhG family)